MKKINWDNKILGGDGIERDREDIETFFTGLFESTIKGRLNVLQESLDPEEEATFGDYLNDVIRNINPILLSKPAELEVRKNNEDNKKREWLANGVAEEKIKAFYEKVHTAFNYTKFRKALLNRFAVVLNVKTCLYCNQQYTIVIGKDPNRNGDINLYGSHAFLQFDHFFGEKEYPILSMSLYNLIPSCPFCNQKKSDRHMSLKLHPYVNDLASMFRFRIKDQAAFVNPKFKQLDLLEVEVETSDDEVKDFVESLDLKRRYARHFDIVKETEIALYMAPYYNGNFEDIKHIFEKGGGYNSDTLRALQRHCKGFYTDSDDINKRPLTKFQQDIYTQLCSWYCGF